jgi:hypothetical protein
MESIYADRIQQCGRGWHRPWLVLSIALLLLGGLARLGAPRRPGQDDAHSRYLSSEIGQTSSRFRLLAEPIDGVLPWTADLDRALACARKNDLLVFVAFHAVTDTNARVNELDVLPQPSVERALKPYLRVMLHIDWVPPGFYHVPPGHDAQRADGRANLAFERKRFGSEQEPLYVILRPTGGTTFDIVAQYEEGIIRDQASFLRFLRDPEQWRADQPTQ